MVPAPVPRCLLHRHRQHGGSWLSRRHREGFHAMRRCRDVTENRRFISRKETSLLLRARGVLHHRARTSFLQEHVRRDGGSGSAGIGLCFSRCRVPAGNTVQHHLAHANKPNTTIPKNPRGAFVSRYPVQYLPLPFNLTFYFLYPLLSMVLNTAAQHTHNPTADTDAKVRNRP